MHAPMVCSVSTFSSSIKPSPSLSRLRALRGEDERLRRLRERRLLAGTQKTQQLHLHHPRVVAGLDAQNPLEHDLLPEDLLLRADAELFGDGAGYEILEDAAVEGADEGDGEGVADDGGV